MILGRLLIEGGWPMVPIYLCSIAAVVVFVRKWHDLCAAHLRDLSWLDGVLAQVRERRVSDARERAQTVEHPAARAICAALDVIETRPARASAEAARAGSLELQRLERHLGALSFIAQVAPLLGLLGTVVGMVDLFLDLEGAQRASLNVSELSSGIWTALLTTAAGLLVAVPTLAAHGYLASRADRIRLLMHDAVEQLLTAAPDIATPSPAANPRTDRGSA